MSHHHTKFKKILRVDSKNKAIKLLDPNWGKNVPFCNIRVFFKNWAPSLFFKYNDVIVCKISKKLLGCIMRKTVYRAINNF